MDSGLNKLLRIKQIINGSGFQSQKLKDSGFDTPNFMAKYGKYSYAPKFTPPQLWQSWLVGLLVCLSTLAFLHDNS
jgi:hypothetical protein